MACDVGKAINPRIVEGQIDALRLIYSGGELLVQPLFVIEAKGGVIGFSTLIVILILLLLIPITTISLVPLIMGKLFTHKKPHAKPKSNPVKSSLSSTIKVLKRLESNSKDLPK